MRQGMHTNSSTVDLDCQTDDDRARLAGVPYWDCRVRAGDALYIPPGWWHYVKATTTSFSVSFWWS
ncbi:hypothetical protein QBZ16_005434 [Prototheca wickerhamii]|uniref:JmjC domain-containing protein n=1 Tax=Prototheca wickerhamii TaxID=3111 RepID=A0AAD9IGF3_PROWI|nr:hypothetical protein QBZ16_005434 [Prototheca wickerhamii]